MTAASGWRVATYNIRHGEGRDRRVDLPRLAEEIAALDAEVVGLQEVDVAFGDRSGGEDQAARLAELLGMQVSFGAAIDLPPDRIGGARRRYGNALLTRHEILAARVHELAVHPAAPPREEPRSLLSTRVRRADGAELDVLVTHLDSGRRTHRTAEVLDLLRRSEDLVGPTVLMGDMNASPSAPELAALAASGWRDALGPRPGVLRGATFPARFPLRRIDVLWLRGELEALTCTVGPCGSSDHRPVVAALRVTA